LLKRRSVEMDEKKSEYEKCFLFEPETIQISREEEKEMK
jgi:hypothetical protein